LKKEKSIRCKSCHRTLSKKEIRVEGAWSKRDGKAVEIHLCKFCGSTVNLNKR
jgi:hypothetical protein